MIDKDSDIDDDVANILEALTNSADAFRGCLVDEPEDVARISLALQEMAKQQVYGNMLKALELMILMEDEDEGYGEIDEEDE